MKMIKLLYFVLLSAIMFSAVMADASGQSIEITAGKSKFIAELEINTAAQEFFEHLPMTLDMSELNGNEKYFYLDKSLYSEPEKIGKIHNGDIMLYGDNCIVIFYKNFSTSYRYTKIGHINDASNLEEALGKGAVTLKFERH